MQRSDRNPIRNDSGNQERLATMLHSNCDNATSKPTTTISTEAAVAVAPIAGDAAIATVEGQTMTLVPSMDLPSSAVSERSELSETADSAAASAASTTAAAAAAAFNAQMRTQQRQKIKSYHDAKQTAVWRTDSLASNPSPDFAAAAGGGGVGPGGGFGGGGGPSRGNVCAGLPMRSIILSTAPSLLQRKASDSSLVGGSIPRRVSFPENELVTGYLEPANPWKQGKFQFFRRL